MDKQTLSNYGWLVIVTLILAVMLALATPFGTYVGDAVVSVANGFVGSSKQAMDEDNISNMEQQWADKLGSVSSESKIESGATFNKQLTAGCNCLDETGSHECLIDIEPVTITWDELQLAENGNKYGYDASAITDTSIGDYAFCECPTIENVTIPSSVTYIGEASFAYLYNQSITYLGTTEQWETIQKHDLWNEEAGKITVTCTDGTITIPAWVWE